MSIFLNPNFNKAVKSQSGCKNAFEYKLRTEQIRMWQSGSVFTNHSQEHSLSFSSRFCEFKYNTTYDWLNRMV